MRTLPRRSSVFWVCSLAALAVLTGGFAHADEPQQVNVNVKILEFQTELGMETGFSAYFEQRELQRPYGRVSSNRGIVEAADITFPIRGDAAITVFLDRISTYYGDIEAVIQALVEEERAFILSRPRAMVPIGSDVPTTVQTVNRVPYEDTVVVGNTAVQITDFRDTGVSLDISVPEVTDDDGDWATNDDTYIKLDVQAEVIEEGARRTVALDDRFQNAEDMALGRTGITAPELVSRSIETSAWVRHGQVLVIGGLYRNIQTRRLDTLPWLTQAEHMATSLAENVISPAYLPDTPVSTALGSSATEEGRRELVFLIKAETWHPAFTLAEEHRFREIEEEDEDRFSPADVISDVLFSPGDVVRDVVGGVGGVIDEVGELPRGMMHPHGDIYDPQVKGIEE